MDVCGQHFSQSILARIQETVRTEPVMVWAVYATEPANPVVESPIEWMLLTTVKVERFEEAQKRVEWYSGRWGIEVYHRTLKSGCRIQDRQLGTADRPETT